MDEQQEIIKEFLVESAENLNQLDHDFVELEQRPEDRDLLSSIFRTIHTIKGTCGFLGFGTLEAVTHRAENILSQLREGERELTAPVTTLLLETVDVVKRILSSIEQTGEEGKDEFAELRDRLQAVCDGAEPETRSAVEPLAAEPEAEPAIEAQAEEDAAEAPEPEVAPEKVVAAPVASAPPVKPAAEKATSDEDHPVRLGAADSNIRVSVDLLDSLMNLVGELVLARNQILQFTHTQEDSGFVNASQRLNLITTELQADVMKTRMQPIRVVWNKLPRVVRDLGQAFGKQIELQMEGADTELDKTIIEAIKDPLTHIIRNSCDHGIETPETRALAGKPAKGHLLLKAYHEGGQVNIEIVDDGGGIDPQKLKQKALQKGQITPDQAERMTDREALDLIFLAGLSTAAKVTNVSGRGVGMDVVRTNIEKIGGSIDLQSTVGRGTTIKIKIPLTLAIIPALVVACGGERFAIPQVNLLELVRIEPGRDQQIESIQGAPVYRLRGKLLPLIYLDDVLRLASARAEQESVNIVVLQADEQTFGLVVDGVQDTAEIVVKPLSKLLKSLAYYAGATIMGDGRVALILDVLGLAQMGGVIGETRQHGTLSYEMQGESASEKQAVLLFRAGAEERVAVPLALVDRLEEFPRERIEMSGGRPVVQYRNKILPLFSLAEFLGRGASAELPDKVQAIVFTEGSKRLGVIVDEIVDIVDESIQVRARSSRRGVMGSAVVDGMVTDFIDLQAIIEEVDKSWFGRRREERAGARVLIAEPSPFSRGLMRNYLEMAGYRVVEAGSCEEAFERLSRDGADMVVTSLDLGAPFELLRKLRTSPELAAIPTLALSSSVEESARCAEQDVQFDDYQLKFDRASMLHSIEKLALAVETREPALALGDRA
ncbi:MAG: chemotaxis protein CheW [Bryobacterales bacterium]|nr:chemotaxis protein CheW [Acidobacteriota bacterium]MCB9383140.1 chemotaxis protein CheW [Bryobacterales bacterium]